MITSIKLAIPKYILGIGVAYIAIVIFVSQEFMAQSVGSSLDNKLAFLSIIVFSDTVYLEKLLNYAEIFSLLSEKRKKEELIRRFFIKLFFMLVLFVLCYFMCFMKNIDYIYIEESAAMLFAKSLFSMICSLFFWGNIVCSFVLITKNIWKGMLLSAVGWYLLNTNMTSRLPIYINVFSNMMTDDSGSLIQGWQYGKLFALLLATICFVFNFWRGVDKYGY